MPTVTVEGSVTLQQAATALQDKLGSRYEVTTHGSGAQQALKVKQSAASTATVHLDQDGNATTFHVDGGGLVISRMVNAFPAELVPELRWHLEQFAEPGERGYVFVGPKGGRLRRSNFRPIWHSARMAVNLPDLHFMISAILAARCPPLPARA